VTVPHPAGSSRPGATSSDSPLGMARHLLGEADALDRAVYETVANTPTPTLDVAMTRLADASNYSRLSLLIAAALAVAGGRRGRRAAFSGLVAVGASSLTADLTAKHLVHRRRPERSPANTGRRARMPTSSSFPSGHTASAFAFATAVATNLPELSLPLYGLATAVGYSRVHNGVHYPGDVMGGAVLGLAVGTVVQAATSRLVSRPPTRSTSSGT